MTEAATLISLINRAGPLAKLQQPCGSINLDNWPGCWAGEMVVGMMTEGRGFSNAKAQSGGRPRRRACDASARLAGGPTSTGHSSRRSLEEKPVHSGEVGTEIAPALAVGADAGPNQPKAGGRQ
jgi:hypothetical protein